MNTIINNVSAPRFPVNLELFRGAKHSPSLPTLERSLKKRIPASSQLRDYCIPVNPYFPTPEIFAHFRDRLEYILKFYPEANESTQEVLGGIVDIPADGLILANGSTELITWIDHLWIHESIATPVPTFGRWTDQPTENHKMLYPFYLHEADDFRIDMELFGNFVERTGTRVAVLCNPNNPTGTLIPQKDLVAFLDRFSRLDLIVIDESFLDFSLEEGIPTMSHEAYRRNNVVVLKSLGKNIGLHGIRAGYAVTNPRLARVLRKALPHWNFNALAIELVHTLKNNMAAYENSRQRVIRDRNYMIEELRKISGLKVYLSYANFAYVKIPPYILGEDLRNYLLVNYGYLLRECGAKIGSDSSYFRIAARPREEMDLLFPALGEALIQKAA